MTRNNTGPCYDHASNLWKPFTKEPYKRSTCSMFLCSKSFLMCLWHQRFPNNFDLFIKLLCTNTSCSCVFPFRWKCGSLTVMQCSMSPSPGQFPERRIWVFSATLKHYMAPCVALCLCVLSPVGPAHHQGWERRLRLSFCLAISPFLKTGRREESVDPHRSVHPSKHPSIHVQDWVSEHSHIHTAFMITIRQLVKRC